MLKVYAGWLNHGSRQEWAVMAATSTFKLEGPMEKLMPASKTRTFIKKYWRESAMLPHHPVCYISNDETKRAESNSETIIWTGRFIEDMYSKGGGK